MKIKINIKRIHLIIFFVLVISLGLYFVIAQSGTVHNPGHTADEISGVCRTSGVGCPNPPISPLQNRGEVVYLSPGTHYCGPNKALLCSFCYSSSSCPWTHQNFDYNFNLGKYQYDIGTSNPLECTSVLCVE